jgi:uncharacterized protein (DUF427 family)
MAKAITEGNRGYYNLEVKGERNDDAALYYREPSAGAAQIEDPVAFWKGVQISA